MEVEALEGRESVTTVCSEPERKPLTDEAVKDAAGGTEFSPAIVPDSTAVKTEPAAKDVKVEAEMEAKEVKKVSETETRVTSNGYAEPEKANSVEDENLPAEADNVDIQLHWHAKPCVHITGLGGVVTQEDLMPLLSPHGNIVSVVFENERRDSAVIRYEVSGSKDEDVVARVRETLSNVQIRDKILVVEPFRPDSLLFIGNLTPEIDDGVLRQMFEPHGTVERAFVLRNAQGRSKGYGFVEYSLKSQASAAKVAMGNINMDGRVLRVEWSDCRKISDMFSTVLFVDRIVKDCRHIEQTLKNIFGQYGKVRDCHLAIGMNQQFRGFAFIDFYHSISADKAHETLDGRDVEGSNIRVSFANPSKSAQSYKSRFGSQAVQVLATSAGRGSFSDHMMRPAMVGASMRGHMAVPLLGSRFMGQGRSNMMGMGIGMQFDRGAPVGPGMIGRSLVPPLLGAGMLGPGSVAAGMMGHGPGMLLGNVPPRAGMPGVFGPHVSRLPAGRGPVPINSAAIAQVATAQAKAREGEAKARAEAQAKQSVAGAKQSAAEQERLEQFRKMAAQQAQLAPQSSQTVYHQQPPSTGLEQHYKQTDTPYPYKSQQQSIQQQPAAHVQHQHQAAVQQISTGQQSQQPFTSQYFPQPTPQYPQAQQSQQPQPQPQKHTQAEVAVLQPQPQQQQLLPQQQQMADQYSQQQAYYQQHGQAPAQTSVGNQQQYAQYSQQYAQQYGQQYSQQQQQEQQQQPYHQTYVQVVEVYPQQVQQQSQTQYTPQDYADYYSQQQQPASQQPEAVLIAADGVSATLAISAQPQDLSQQQSYEAYYQQLAQEAVAQAGTTVSQTMTAAASPQQNLEAQWAAYYAAQTALQQVGTASAYDQQHVAYAQQQQGYVATGSAGYYQQSAAVEVGHKRTAEQIDYSAQAQASYAYPQQSTAAVPAYNQQQAVNGMTPYQQPPSAGTAVYQQPVSTVSSYQQPASAYQQHGAGVAAYVQPAPSLQGYMLSAAPGYQQATNPHASVYQQQVATVSTGYQQMHALAVQGYLQPNQSSVPTPAYDYSKRPRL